MKILHPLISHRKIKKQYETTFRICYDISQDIRFLASDMDIRLESSSKRTLCGSIVTSGTGAAQRHRTITCLIEIKNSNAETGSKFYALTADHEFSSDPLQPATAASQEDREEQEDNDDPFEDDVEPALVIDEWSPGRRVQGITTTVERLPKIRTINPTVALGQVDMRGREWALISVKDPLMLLPNLLEGGSERT